MALVLALLIATSVSMVFGELVPKNLAVARPVPTARAAAGPQVLFSMLLTPLIRLTNGTANWILRRIGIEPAEELRSARSPQELGALVRNSARHGSLDPITATLVDRSLRFGTRTAEELMTPRTEIEALHADDTVADLVAKAIETGLLPLPDRRGRPRRNHRHRAHQAGVSDPARPNAPAPGWPIWPSRSPWCPPRWTATRCWSRSGPTVCKPRW